RVLDAQGAPRSGARVRASREVGALRDMDRTPVPTARTDERGEFVLDWVQPGEVEVRASDPDDPSAGRARARLECVAGERNQVELALDPEPSIRGRVVDGEGRPLEGWRVHARSADRLEMSPFHPGTSSLVDVRSTDAEGRFVFQNAGDLRWNLAVAAPGESPFPPRATLEGVRASDGEVEIVIENTATEACVLAVRLVDANGRPPQDVQAALWDEQRTAGTFPEYDASTGVARWSVSLPGRYAVQVRRGARSVHHGELVELRPGETVDLGEIHLVEPGELVVEISGPEAWGLEHVGVSVVAVDGIEELHLERDDLTFRVVAVAPGRYVLRAGHKALFAPEREVEVRPREVTRVEVELVQAFPARVTFEFPDTVEQWRSVDWEVRDSTGSKVRSGHVRNWPDIPGTAAPGIHGLGLPPGRYMLLATTDAGLRAELALDVTDARSARGPHVLAFHP
ncbi:MAG TPA: carboxypeptidase-like regulatory domain-containing protein, partial [Planctomycetota bacterium]|nr:carboxypeptidase-like regulatory domain-containing protein [Planctomycetota bacterium]